MVDHAISLLLGWPKRPRQPGHSLAPNVVKWRVGTTKGRTTSDLSHPLSPHVPNLRNTFNIRSCLRSPGRFQGAIARPFYFFKRGRAHRLCALADGILTQNQAPLANFNLNMPEVAIFVLVGPNVMISLFCYLGPKQPSTPVTGDFVRRGYMTSTDHIPGNPTIATDVQRATDYKR